MNRLQQFADSTGKDKDGVPLTLFAEDYSTTIIGWPDGAGDQREILYNYSPLGKVLEVSVDRKGLSLLRKIYPSGVPVILPHPSDDKEAQGPHTITFNSVKIIKRLNYGHEKDRLRVEEHPDNYNIVLENESHRYGVTVTKKQIGHQPRTC